jgi:hypothetical protein
MPQTLVIRSGARTEVMGAANDGVWVEAQIRQTVDAAWAERSAQK